MGRETVLFKSETKKSRAEVAALLRQAADKIEQGHITLLQGDVEVVLDIPEIITFEIKAEEESKRALKRSLEFELEWLEGADQGSNGATIC